MKLMPARLSLDWERRGGHPLAAVGSVSTRLFWLNAAAFRTYEAENTRPGPGATSCLRRCLYTAIRPSSSCTYAVRVCSDSRRSCRLFVSAPARAAGRFSNPFRTCCDIRSMSSMFQCSPSGTSYAAAAPDSGRAPPSPFRKEAPAEAPPVVGAPSIVAGAASAQINCAICGTANPENNYRCAACGAALHSAPPGPAAVDDGRGVLIPYKNSTTRTIPTAPAWPRWLLVVGVIAAGTVLFFFDPVRTWFYPQCLFHTLTGLQCPGCGSLRALHALLHGEIRRAVALNPLLFVAGLFFGYVALKRHLRPNAPSLLSHPAAVWVDRAEPPRRVRLQMTSRYTSGWGREMSTALTRTPASARTRLPAAMAD